MCFFREFDIMNDMSVKPSSLIDPQSTNKSSAATATAVAGLASSFKDLVARVGLHLDNGLNDISGKSGITAVGDNVDNFRPGDRVFGLLTGGGYAEQVAVPATHLLPLPDERDFAWGAAIAEVFLTSFTNLFIEAGLQEGETVLIHGGASGVGTAAIQLCREAGCKVLITAGTNAKIARCRELGADLAINYKEQDFAEAVLAHADGVDVILDIAGADYLARNIRLLKLRGRLVVIALLTGADAQIDLQPMMVKRLRLIGSGLRSRSDGEKTAIIAAFKKRFWPMLVDGTMQTVVEEILPIERAADAQAILAKNRNIGKVILQVRP